jgi:hypothetical protein
MHKHSTFGRVVFIRLKPTRFGDVMVIHNNFANRMASAGDGPFKFLPYQLDGSVLDYRGFNG